MRWDGRHPGTVVGRDIRRLLRRRHSRQRSVERRGVRCRGGIGQRSGDQDGELRDANGLHRPLTYELEVTGLHRRGPFAVLEGRLTCTKGDQFDTCDGEFVVSGGGSENLNTAAGIMLLDPVGKKEYLVVNFPAPPDGVTSLTVLLPGGGQPQITDVPVS